MGREHEFCANCDPEVHDGRHAEGMKQGDHTQNFLLAGSGPLAPERQLHGIGIEVGVGQARTLGQPGCPTSVLQHGDILNGVDVDRIERRAGFGQPLIRNVPVVLGDRRDIAAFQKRKQGFLTERQNARHGADDDPFEAIVLVQQRRDFSIAAR